MLKNMAISMERLEKATGENVKREQEIREQARREAAEVAEKIAKRSGLSTESVQELRSAHLTIRNEAGFW